jgi:hypothetical protein
MGRIRRIFITTLLVGWILMLRMILSWPKQRILSTSTLTSTVFWTVVVFVIVHTSVTKNSANRGLAARNRSRRAVAVRPAPGHLLLRAAEFLASERTFSLVFEPVVTDLRREYADALRQGRPRKAMWVRFRRTADFFSHVGAQLPVGLGRLVMRLWGISR